MRKLTKAELKNLGAVKLEGGERIYATRDLSEGVVSAFPPTAEALAALRDPVHFMKGSDPIERDSAEADAAQAMFVEHGFSAEWVIAECNPAGWGLVNYAAYEAWSQKQAAERLRNFRLAPRPLKFPIKPTVMVMDFDRPSVGGGKTALMFGTEVHQAMDASQRNEKLKQELIRQYTNSAAFKLGASATLGVDSPLQRRKQKQIKDHCAQCLVLIGCSYSEIAEIIGNMVEGLRNV